MDTWFQADPSFWRPRSSRRTPSLSLASGFLTHGFCLFLDLPTERVLPAAIDEGQRVGPSRFSVRVIAGLDLFLFLSIHLEIVLGAQQATRGAGFTGLFCLVVGLMA